MSGETDTTSKPEPLGNTSRKKVVGYMVIDESLLYTPDELRALGIHEMRDMGMSIREIQKVMGYKSPRSIQVLLSK